MKALEMDLRLDKAKGVDAEAGAALASTAPSPACHVAASTSPVKECQINMRTKILSRARSVR